MLFIYFDLKHRCYRGFKVKNYISFLEKELWYLLYWYVLFLWDINVIISIPIFLRQRSQHPLRLISSMNHNIEQGFEFWITIRNPENTEFQKTESRNNQFKMSIFGIQIFGIPWVWNTESWTVKFHIQVSRIIVIGKFFNDEQCNALSYNNIEPD